MPGWHSLLSLGAYDQRMIARTNKKHSVEKMIDEKNKIVELRKATGRTLELLRKKAGLSQFDLALELGFTNHYLISKIETGKESIPPRHIPALATILKVSEDVFLQPIIEMKKLNIMSELKRRG